MRILATLAALAAALVLAAPTAHAQGSMPVQVHVDLHLLSIGNYDATQGAYIADFYMHLQWNASSAPVGFTAANFEFMNGDADTQTLISDDIAQDGTRDVWYRIKASLYNEPTFEAYPFDDQQLAIKMEDPENTLATQVYVPGTITVDDELHVGGWNLGTFTATTNEKDYPFGEQYSRITFTLNLEREKVASGMRAFLPPLAFMVVASFSFFFDRAQAANRLALGTGMLITAVGFHISQSVSLPTLGALSLFDRVMISVYSFIAATILVTAIMAFEGRFKVPERAVALVQKRGAWLSFAVPVVVFLLLLIR